MTMYALVFLGCALLLLFASKIVYAQVIVLADKLRVPPFLVSLLLVAFSTSIPELFVGVTSAVDSVPTLSLGDVLGSNIVNLTFIAGLTMLVGRKRTTLHQSMSRKQLAMNFGVALAPILLVLDGTLSRADGILLLLLYIAYIYISLAGSHRVGKSLKGKDVEIARSLGIFFFGAFLLIVGSAGIVKSASVVSASLDISPFIIGIFAVALSTSLPELVFAIRAAFNRNTELGLAELVGSCAVNATAVLGLVAVIRPIFLDAYGAIALTGVFSALTFLAFFFLVGQKTTSPLRGVLLIALYAAFVLVSIAL